MAPSHSLPQDLVYTCRIVFVHTPQISSELNSTSNSSHIRRSSLLAVAWCSFPPMPPSYAPPGESAADLVLERANYAGMMLVSFGYGIYVCIACACAQALLARPAHRDGKRNWPMLVYISLLSLSATIFWLSNWIWGQTMFIDQRNFPGGPAGFFLNNFGVWSNTMSDVAFTISVVLSDGLVLWRCALIWDYNCFIVSLGVLTYITTTVFSALSVYQTSKPGQNPLHDIQFTIPYFSLSLTLNLALTLLIVGRLLWHRRELRAAMDAVHSRTYLTLAAILIESAALYSLTSLALIVSLGLGSAVPAVVLPLLGEIVCISPMLIIFRVARGHGFARDASTLSRTANTSFQLRTGSTFRRLFNLRSSQDPTEIVLTDIHTVTGSTPPGLDIRTLHDSYSLDPKRDTSASLKLGASVQSGNDTAK